MILALSVLFLAHAPPLWVRAAGARAGAGAGVAAVALRAGIDLLCPSYRQARERGARRITWLGYLLVGGLAAAFLGAYLVLALVACGLAELALQRRALRPSNAHPDRLACLVPFAAVKGGIGALTWTAFKIGALAFGGGFVIIPHAGRRRPRLRSRVR
jgi:chromate transporter